MVTCPLCSTESALFYTYKTRQYYSCPNCYGVFLDPEALPKPYDEKERYTRHDNDVNDERYRNFVRPLFDVIRKNCSPQHKGLDYGAGTGPVIAAMLREEHYTIALYDPFFHPNTEALTQKYDYIVCSEVVEHFHKPMRDFSLLYKLLIPNGKLLCLTSVFYNHIDFARWYYKNDKTHSFFYRPETLKYISQILGFAHMQLEKNVVVFTK